MSNQMSDHIKVTNQPTLMLPISDHTPFMARALSLHNMEIAVRLLLVVWNSAQKLRRQTKRSDDGRD